MSAIKGGKREKTRSRAQGQERVGLREGVERTGHRDRDVQESPAERSWGPRRKNFTMMYSLNYP
jgi:hypothetical protein